MELQSYAKTYPGIDARCGAQYKYRTANLTYCEALNKFGQYKSMDTLPAVRAALKEVYV